MYRHYLNTENAQKIADGIMKVIPYNIYIMDTEGIIIASGDKTQIGSCHQGALTALQKKESYLVHESTTREQKGINLPILYNNTIVGVIAINGEISDVMPIGQICMSMALLMIENQLLNHMSAIKESRLKDFLYDWIMLPLEQYDNKFYDRAGYLGIDLKIPRIAVMIVSRKIRYSVIETIKGMLRPDEYIVRQGMDDILILLKGSDDLDNRLNEMMDISKDFKYCYVGEIHTVASYTVHTVLQTFQMSKTMKMKRKILYYQDISLECLLSDIKMTKEIERIIKVLKEKDPDNILKETIYAYAEDNDNYTAICEKMHIHRNTLNYRLAKIEEILNRNPRKAKDFMVLYIAVIQMRDQ